MSSFLSLLGLGLSPWRLGRRRKLDEPVKRSAIFDVPGPKQYISLNGESDAPAWSPKTTVPEPAPLRRIGRCGVLVAGLEFEAYGFWAAVEVIDCETAAVVRTIDLCDRESRAAFRRGLDETFGEWLIRQGYGSNAFIARLGFARIEGDASWLGMLRSVFTCPWDGDLAFVVAGDGHRYGFHGMRLLGITHGSADRDQIRPADAPRGIGVVQFSSMRVPMVLEGA